MADSPTLLLMLLGGDLLGSDAPPPRTVRWPDAPPPTPMTTTGVGHFVSWEGGCLLIGRALVPIPTHAHYAMQIAFGAEPGIRFRTDEREEWTDYAGVVIASRQPHAMDATRVSASAVLLVEPESPQARALAERWLGDAGIVGMPGEVIADIAPALFRAWRESGAAPAVAAAAREVLRSLAGGAEPTVVVDERILRAIAHINAHLDESLTLEQVAAEAFLSPGRFRHLFVEQTGMALRPYILWRRFLRVWELLTTGATLSAAAHSAGFADAAHLTRTSHRMFGFPPSALEIKGRSSDG